jgi:hypothetical protein
MEQTMPNPFQLVHPPPQRAVNPPGAPPTPRPGWLPPDWESGDWPVNGTAAAFAQWLASRLDMLPYMAAIARHWPQRNRLGTDRKDTEASVAGRLVRDIYRMARLLRAKGFNQVADDEQPCRTYTLHDAELIVRIVHRQLTTGLAAGGSASSSAQAAAPDGSTGPKMTVKQANDKAKALANADPAFVMRSQREWAKAIGCSKGLVGKLPLWQKNRERTNTPGSNKTPAPNAVPLTDDLVAVTGDRAQGRGVVDKIIDDEDAARAKQRWEESSPNRKWEDLSPEEQRREIASAIELDRLVAEQKAKKQEDEGRRFRPRRRP